MIKLALLAFFKIVLCEGASSRRATKKFKTCYKKQLHPLPIYQLKHSFI